MPKYPTGQTNSMYDYRICIGRHMANNAIFLNMATILWAVNITALTDDAGKPIIPNTLEAANAGISMSGLFNVQFISVTDGSFPLDVLYRSIA